MHAFFLAALIVSGPWAAAPNPCTNGSFEELAPNGFPLDWERVGQTVEAVSDAHTGQRALRLLRREDPLKGELRTSETGLNRTWKAHSGERGAMVACLKGGIEFWYKALSAADGTRLTVQAIPMTAEPIEGTDSPRAIFDVPKEHIADGQWHQGRLKYDFTGDPKAKWVHFGGRILGRAGGFLLDDFAYVEKVGPILRISRLRLDEDPKRPGARCTISALIENVGDAPAPDVHATLTAPPELRSSPAEFSLGDLAPDATPQVIWNLDGTRTSAIVLALKAASRGQEAVDSIAIAPRLAIESYGPREPVVGSFEPFRMECVVRNVGNAVAIGPKATFEFPPVRVRGTRRIPGHPEGHSEEYEEDAILVQPAVASGACKGLMPGEAVTLRAAFRAGIPGPVSGSIRVGAANIRGDLTAEVEVVVAQLAKLPRPSGCLRSLATDDYALVENSHVRLAFHRTPGAHGLAELWLRGRGGWRRSAWLLRLGELVEQQLWNSISPWDVPRVELGKRATLRFDWGSEDPRVQHRAPLEFSLGEQDKSVLVDYGFTSAVPLGLLALKGPGLQAMDREEAVFPGVEWLVDDELSSSALDVAENHPDRRRFVVHPNMVTIPAVGIHGRNGTVGLIWDVHQKWDGVRDRPSVGFASPDRIHNKRTHLVQLFMPSVPDFVEPNAWEASKPYALRPNQPLRLRCLIFADGEAKDALAAVDEWIRLYGLPEPQPLPHGSYEREIEFSMQGYLESLWVPETQEWWTSKGGGRIMSKKGRPHNFVADLLLGSLVSPDEAVRKQCRERAEEMAALLKCEPRLDAMRFPGRFDLAIANPARAAGLLATMGDDGAWRFDADQEGRGPFVGKDYHELGPDNAVEVGTCARKAFEVLRYARIAGDAEAFERMQKTLRLMETFRVPRAAQVWEVPVHTPDLLAAADAVDAYLEAYRFSGDERWLRDAVTWARRGIPFIYLWNPPDKPWLLGASIPVYGATWFTGSWFGRPVQWNGLRYATAILKLAEHDQSKDWRRLAELIIRSAILQQDPDGENVALWPDNISAIDGKKCPWVFAPRQVIQNILLLNGRDEEPQTTILRRKPFLAAERRIHISATARVSDAAWNGDLLTFTVAYPQGEEGTILVANVAKPTAVTLDGKRLAERSEVEKGAEPAWRYDDALAYLCVRIASPATASTPVILSEAKDLSREAADTTRVAAATGAGSPERFFAPLRSAQNDSVMVRIEGARHRRVDRLPTLAERLDFAFDRSAEGWMAAHDIADLAVRGGALCGRATAPDPYIVRSLVRVKGDDCPVLLIRLRSTAGPAAQCFWTTEASPAFDEAKSLRFQVEPDGEWRDYRLEVGKHPQWAGQTITAMRLDPGDAPGEFAVDLIRGGIN
ncbi:MAG TPA: hypothetical protein VNE39_00700 [Planctomycetota bacterium]|nr:hypothetical protein [Planctomycetota bacterium]